jgi:hypothetical protein
VETGTRSIENDNAQPGTFSPLKWSPSMYYLCPIHVPAATRCQLLTFSILVATLLFETTGLVHDLSMPGGRASVGVQMNTMTLGQIAQPEIHDQWPARSVVEPMAIEADPNPVMSDDRDRGSTAQKDQLPLHERRMRTNHRSVSLLPLPERYVRSRSLSRLQSSGACSVESNKTP